MAEEIRSAKLKSNTGRPPHLRALVGALLLKATRHLTFREAEDLIRYYAPARFLCGLTETEWSPDHNTLHDFEVLLAEEGVRLINEYVVKLALKEKLTFSSLTPRLVGARHLRGPELAGSSLVLHGHGRRERQLRGPPAPGEPARTLLIFVRRYQCQRRGDGGGAERPGDAPIVFGPGDGPRVGVVRRRRPVRSVPTLRPRQRLVEAQSERQGRFRAEPAPRTGDPGSSGAWHALRTRRSATSLPRSPA